MLIFSAGCLSVVNTCADDGGSPLYLAAQGGFYDCVKLLLDHGADPNLPCSSPIAQPIHAAIQFGHIE